MLAQTLAVIAAAVAIVATPSVAHAPETVGVFVATATLDVSQVIAQ